MISPTRSWVENEVKRRGWVWFGNGEYNVNLVGVRNPEEPSEGDPFNDWLTLSYRTFPDSILYPWGCNRWQGSVPGARLVMLGNVERETGWCFHAFPATLDPGIPYLLDPMNPLGTAIIAEQQARGAYKLGLHRGKYPALVQHKPVKFWRDNTRDARRDHVNLQEAAVGLNIHHAARTSTPESDVGMHSAGCSVIPTMTDWNLFLAIMERSAAAYGETFTYTVLESRKNA